MRSAPSDRTIGQPAAVRDGGRVLGDSAMKGNSDEGTGTGLGAPHLESEACSEIPRPVYGTEAMCV
jgi:hypothetical protein